MDRRATRGAAPACWPKVGALIGYASCVLCIAALGFPSPTKLQVFLFMPPYVEDEPALELDFQLNDVAVCLTREGLG